MPIALSIVDYIHAIKDVGFTDRQAEAQAKQLEQQLEHVQIKIKKDLKHEVKTEINVDDLATRANITRLELDIKQVELKIEKAKNQMLMWIGAYGAFMFGVMTKGFHWI